MRIAGHAAGLMLLLLPACGGDAGPRAAAAPPAGGGTLHACQMRGAAAEDRYAGALGDLSIDSATARAGATQACLDGNGRRP